MTHFLLVRHGQTEWNRIRRVQGQTDAQLDEVGRDQARLVGERLASEEGVTAVYASDLSRAMDTAKAIVSHHPDLEITADQRMREIGFGPWEGKYWQEFEGEDAELFQKWRNDITSVTIPG
ncbi:MAG: histidine phosphatase family protein, partial [Chloroflexota bacterium]